MDFIDILMIMLWCRMDGLLGVGLECIGCRFRKIREGVIREGSVLLRSFLDLLYLFSILLILYYYAYHSKISNY